jgi:uncharacterized membrane protein YqiK
MTGNDFGAFILGLIALAIAVAISIWLLRWLYVRSSKDRAFVRTGFGGQKIILDGGAFMIPIIHEAISVNMNTVRLAISRGRNDALISKDRMRVDVTAEFFVRVQATPQSVAAAAQTLGNKTTDSEQLKELIEGKFVDALRTIAAGMTMEELHEQRGMYVRAVREAVAEDLLKNGLELESASLTQLDQTAMEYFNPGNTFDAEGLTRLIEQIERRKKERNDVEQNTLISIRTKNLETEKLVLELDRDGEYARLMQQREVEVARVRQRSEVSIERAEREREAESAQLQAKSAMESARIQADQALAQERIVNEKTLQTSEIARRTAIELAEQQRVIDVADKSRAQYQAQSEADLARAQAVLAEEKVYTARDRETAERKKAIELIVASQAGEKEALRMKLAVDAERAAAQDRGEIVRMQAVAESDAEHIRVSVARLRAEADAEAARLMNESHNMLTPEARVSLFRQTLLEKMEGMIRESARPMERIEGIKILNVSGLCGATGGSAESAGLPEQIVNSALRFRAQAPLMDSLLREIGIEGGSLEKMVTSAASLSGADSS